MATTTILPVHITKEWGAAQSIKRAIDYVMNPEKTDDKVLVTGYECEPDFAHDDFMFSRDEYQFKTGRDFGDSEILVYHVRQSFVPGEVGLDTVRKLGYDLAMELTGAKNAFIVATHTDKVHLHNHIIINAVNLECDKKFRNEIGSFRRVQKISDRLCKEHNLSVVLNPKPSKNIRPRYASVTKRDIFAKMIDGIITDKQPKDFDDFLKHLEKSGCKVRCRGSTISVRPPGAERYFRFKCGKKGLPDGYDEESLRRRIADMQLDIHSDLRDDYTAGAEKFVGEVHTDTEQSNDDSSVMDEKYSPVADAPPATRPEEPIAKMSHDKKINLLIDIENSLKAKDSSGYQRWAEKFNLQQAAETMLFLQTNNLTNIENLYQAAVQVKSEYDTVQNYMAAADARIKEVNALQRHIGAYNKNRDIYSEYLRSKRNPKFRQDNEKAIVTVEEAKAYFNSLGLEKLPTIKELQAEYSALSQERLHNSQRKAELSRYISDLESARKNIELLLGIEPQRNNQQRKNNRSADVR